MQSNRVVRTHRRSQNEVFVRSTVIKVERAETSTSRQLDNIDEWAGLAGSEFLLPAPYNVNDLFRFIEQSSILGPCIDAYVTNTVGTGWEVRPRYRGAAMKEAERVELESFVDNANSNESLSTVMRKAIQHREAVGYGFIEGIRDASGTIALVRHASSATTRLSARHQTEVLVEYTIQRGRRVIVVKEFRKFRRFVQIVSGKYVWFREWGDPRKLNRTTGLFEGEDGYTAGNDATEILHLKLPSNEPYGVPRWIANLPSIIGSREAEEVNMNYFKDNTVPPMMLTVSGGRLTKSSFQELSAMLQRETIGKDRQNRIMLIEAVGDTDSLDGKGTPVQLKVEKLTDQRQSDGLFSEYDDASQAKVRQSWRLPGILVGQNSDSNYANAQVSVFLADSQVFGPGRDEIDEVLDKQIVFPTYGLNLSSVKLVSRPPAVNSPDATIKALTAINVMGGVTPRSAQKVANTVLQMEIDQYPDAGAEGHEEWMDKPLVLSRQGNATHAEQAAKSTETKETEEDGDINFKRPENGSEGEGMPNV